MNDARWVLFGCVVLGTLATALRAASLWWLASKVSVDEPIASIDDNPAAHHGAALVAFITASQLSARAARWTAVSAVLSAAAALAGPILLPP